MVLVAVLNDGGLGELTIIGALMSSFVRLMLVLYNAGSSGEVCFLVLFYFADFMLIVDLHYWWLCKDWRRRIIFGLLNWCWGFHPWWRCRDLLRGTWYYLGDWSNDWYWNELEYPQ